MNDEKLSEQQETIVERALDMYLDQCYSVLPVEQYRALEHDVEVIKNRLLS